MYKAYVIMKCPNCETKLELSVASSKVHPDYHGRRFVASQVPRDLADQFVQSKHMCYQCFIDVSLHADDSSVQLEARKVYNNAGLAPVRPEAEVMVKLSSLFSEAVSLLSDKGENAEYDRALAEIVTFMSGGNADDVQTTADAIRTAYIASCTKET